MTEKDTDDAAFRLQQAIEKYLKGFLLARGWRLRRIHDLGVLLSEAVRHDPGLERYPSLEESPSLADCVHSSQAAGAQAVRSRPTGSSAVSDMAERTRLVAIDDEAGGQRPALLHGILSM